MMSSFLNDLKRFGPEGGDRLDPAAARRYCADLAATHYENFSVATRLTPAELRPHFANVYAFCRWSDDLGDEIGDRGESRRLLAWWRRELQAAFEGKPIHPVMVALRETVEEFEIPIEPFQDLISAFEQDQEILEYDTYERLLDYCERSANPVGRLVLHMGRSFTLENARLADRTCTALQLANFWQDVSRDLAIGRIYLPREDRERFGVSVEQLRERRFSAEFAALLRFETERTRALFDEGRALIDRLPRRLRFAVDLFGRGGVAVLDRIEKRGYDVLTARPSLSKLDKIGLMGRAWVSSWRSKAALTSEEART